MRCSGDTRDPTFALDEASDGGRRALTYAAGVSAASKPARSGELTATQPNLLQRVWGGLLMLVATVLVTLLEIFFLPYVIGTQHIPISLVLLVLGSPLLCAGARWALGHPLGALLPLPVWFVLSALGNYKTATGDLLITAGNWVASVYVLLGLVVWLGSIIFVARR